MVTVAAELLPQPVRGIGLGMTCATYWALTFAASQSIEPVLRSMGMAATFFCLAGGSACALIFVAVFIPETGNVSFDDVNVVSSGSPESRLMRTPGRSPFLGRLSHRFLFGPKPAHSSAASTLLPGASGEGP